MKRLAILTVVDEPTVTPEDTFCTTASTDYSSPNVFSRHLVVMYLSGNKIAGPTKTMSRLRAKNLQQPDEIMNLEGVTQECVDIGDITACRVTYAPGFRWTTHIKPIAGGEWCEIRHVGLMLSGRIGIVMQDGSTFELGPDDVFDIPPGHDGFVIGHEPCVMFEWHGTRAFASPVVSTNRVLATLLLTQISNSASVAQQLGDGAWRARLSDHFESLRNVIEITRGVEVRTTSDGLLAKFESPGAAITCAEAICRLTAGDVLQIRAAVHVGEVDVVGQDIRGVALYEVESLITAAAANEIVVSETARALLAASGLTFDDRGEHELPGLNEARRVFVYISRNEIGGA